jgi:hypothetical protein
MKINILTIQQSEHRFTTIGDWKIEYAGITRKCGRFVRSEGITDFTRPKELTIWITEMPDWRWWISVLVHELFEVCYCMVKGITNKECDEFDAYYETQYDAGLIPRSQEAGYDKRAPYHVGHVWGDRLSWIVDKLLRTNQKEMYAYFDTLMSIEE